MSNPWFRLYAEFANDPKVQIMSEQDQRRLVMVLCMRCNGDVTLQDKHVTFQLRITPQEWAVSKAVFIDAGFIDSDNNVLNWDKRQYVSDSSATRVARHRALHKDVIVTPCNVTVTPPEQNRTDTEQKQKQSNTKASADKKTPKPKTISPLETLLALGVADQAANDWLTVRKAKRAPLTETALDELKLEAGKAGITVAQAVAICAKRSWQGFSASWNWKDEAQGRKTPSPDNFATKDYGQGISDL